MPLSNYIFDKFFQFIWKQKQQHNNNFETIQLKRTQLSHLIASPFPKQHYKVYFFFTDSCQCGVQMLFDFHCKSLGLVSCTAKVGIPPVGFLGCKHLNLCSFLASFLLFDFPIWVGLLSNLGGYLKSFLQNQHNN